MVLVFESQGHPSSVPHKRGEMTDMNEGKKYKTTTSIQSHTQNPTLYNYEWFWWFPKSPPSEKIWYSLKSTPKLMFTIVVLFRTRARGSFHPPYIMRISILCVVKRISMRRPTTTRIEFGTYTMLNATSFRSNPTGMEVIIVFVLPSTTETSTYN